MPLPRFLHLLGGAGFVLAAAGDAPVPDKSSAVRAVMQAAAELEDVPFRDVVHAATGRTVRKLDPARDAVDAAIIDHLARAAESVRAFLNAPDSPVRGLRRINEASRHCEDRLVKALATDGFTCTPAPNAEGDAQRAGYPDLRLVHTASGRVVYVDPKLHEADSASSTLRTFYYEPRVLTGKIREDAAHVVIGFAHDGKDGAWTFTSWRLVDLHGFRVRLKAEFQASNRELYDDANELRRSPR